jgi:aldehyde:ferredoxin oxidoreductase
MRYGYQGKVLRVDLSSRTSELQELPERLLRDFVGGVVGLANLAHVNAEAVLVG